MIIKKSKIELTFLKKIFSIIKKNFLRLISILGLITFLSTSFFIYFYFSSGLKSEFSPNKLVKLVDEKILNRHFGFDFKSIDDQILFNIKKIKYLFRKNNIPTVQINVNQKGILELERQRESKLNRNVNDDISKWVNGNLIHNKKKYRVKLRVKGDRTLHFYKKNETSYRVDLKGDKRLWGLEEFSIQKPITRHYAYEFVFHKLLEHIDLINLKYFLVEFYFNDENRNVFVIEEGFSKELIERHKKRNGPIFGIEDAKSLFYPKINYDLYSKTYWEKSHPDLIRNAYSILNGIKDGNLHVNEYFDLDKWAKYFAIIDLTSSLHGSSPKSVRLFYNPASGKFEPIGFDAHYSGLLGLSDFIILDFLDVNDSNCSLKLLNANEHPWVCKEKEWYLKFLRKKDASLNQEFIDSYLRYLKLYSSEGFLKKFNKKYQDEITAFNDAIYRDDSKRDVGFSKGLFDYIYNPNYIKSKAKVINLKITNLNSKFINFSLKKNKVSIDNLKNSFLIKLETKCTNDKFNKTFYVYNASSFSLNDGCDLFLIKEKFKEKIKLSENMSIEKDSYQLLFSDLDKFHIYYKLNQNNFGEYILDKSIHVSKNFYIPKDLKLIIKPGVQIIFKKNVSIISEGQTYFQGTIKNPIIVKSEKELENLGSIILKNNFFQINNVVFKNLSNPNFISHILYGGINVIDSELEFKNSKIINSNSEDGINIINSNSVLNNIQLINIASDGIDIDFGKFTFENIKCFQVNNDCLDISGSIVNGKDFYAENISDKGLSIGEASVANIKNIFLKNNKLGIAVKDGSTVNIENFNSDNNNYEIAVFNKKKEYKESTLNINQVKTIEDKKILVGKSNNLIINDSFYKIKKKNALINEIFY